MLNNFIRVIDALSATELLLFLRTRVASSGIRGISILPKRGTDHVYKHRWNSDVAKFRRTSNSVLEHG